MSNDFYCHALLGSHGYAWTDIYWFRHDSENPINVEESETTSDSEDFNHDEDNDSEAKELIVDNDLEDDDVENFSYAKPQTRSGS
ncbi:hypothetical protein ACTXT7_016727 [Hymenolepis weldensis]